MRMTASAVVAEPEKKSITRASGSWAVIICSIFSKSSRGLGLSKYAPPISPRR
jgi:hypothetical protein